MGTEIRQFAVGINLEITEKDIFRKYVAKIRFSESPLFPISCERMTGFPVSLSPKGLLLLAQESPLGKTAVEKRKKGNLNNFYLANLSLGGVERGAREGGIPGRKDRWEE